MIEKEIYQTSTQGGTNNPTWNDNLVFENTVTASVMEDDYSLYRAWMMMIVVDSLIHSVLYTRD